MDKELAKIVKAAIESEHPKCPKCKVEGIVQGFGEIAWYECPKCKGQIGPLAML